MNKGTKKRNAMIALSVLIFLLIAVYIHTESFRYPYIGMVTSYGEEGWKIVRIHPDGQAGSWAVGPGDRIMTIDGEPAERWGLSRAEASLTKVKSIGIERADGSIVVAQVALSQKETYKNIFSILAEVILIGIGSYAYWRNKDSVLIRKFFRLNVVMAFIMLTLFSTELIVSSAILSLCAIWLPYLLLSFFVAFVFRTVHSRLYKLFGWIKAFSALFSAYTLYTVVRDEIPGWIRETVHLAVMLSLAIIILMARWYWRSLDRIEKNHVLVFVTGLFFSLLPYLFLYAIPELLWNRYTIPPEYALVGLVPLSGTILYVLIKRKMLDMQAYMPRLFIQSGYFGGVFLLFYVASMAAKPAYWMLSFAFFVVLTIGYQQGLLRLKRKSEQREQWLERQKLQLSIRLAEKNNVRDIMRMLAETIHSMIDIEGVCLIWNEGIEPLVHGTGKYAQAERKIGALLPDLDMVQREFEFQRIIPIAYDAADQGEGFLCIGHKTNQTLFSPEERKLIDNVRIETFRLLSNAKRLTELQKEYERTKERHHTLERRAADARAVNYWLLEAQEAERIRTSYFLHDHLLQNLIYVSRDLEGLYDGGEVEKKQVMVWLRCMYESQRDIRMLCDDLYPHVVDKSGLKESLQWLIRTVKERAELRIELSYELNADREVPALLKSNAFRIVRELMNNVCKHAEAANVHIRLRDLGTVLHCVVSDDGKGFDSGAVLGLRSANKHLGFVSIGNQVRHLGGDMEIDSAAGKGTTVTIRLPWIKDGGQYGESDQSRVTG